MKVSSACSHFFQHSKYMQVCRLIGFCKLPLMCRMRKWDNGTSVQVIDGLGGLKGLCSCCISKPNMPSTTYKGRKILFENREHELTS